MSTFTTESPFRLLGALVLALGLTGPALAEVAPPAGPMDGAWCQSHPEQCQRVKQRMQERCEADPQRCEQMKARAAKFREQCKTDPQACEAKKAEMRERWKQRRAGQAPQN